MELFWFLLGLLIGLLAWGWYYIQLNLKLKRLLRKLNPNTTDWPLSTTSRLTRAIAIQTQAQEQVEQELEIWQRTFDLAPIGFLQVDEDNQLIWCNDSACDLLGIQPGLPIKPRLLLELVRSYELDHLIEQTRTVNRPYQSEWTFHPVSPDPTKLSQQQSHQIRAYGFPLLNRSVGVFLESRQEAVLLAQQRDRWISDVAHELKTPLTSIRLVAETLQARLEPAQREWMNRLLQETLRLSSLVQDLLDLSQLEAHPQPKLNLKAVDLPSLIQVAWSSLEPLARQKQIQLQYTGPSQLLLEADESRLHRVLLNLLDNSIKYSPTKQNIQVQLSLQTDGLQASAVLDVIDAGPGFPEEAIPLIFERFYRVDPSRTRNPEVIKGTQGDSLDQATSVYSRSFSGHTQDDISASNSVSVSSGSGLGLAIVRQIVEAHQGQVRARNHPDAGGAWLQVILPLD